VYGLSFFLATSKRYTATAGRAPAGGALPASLKQQQAAARAGVTPAYFLKVINPATAFTIVGMRPYKTCTSSIENLNEFSVTGY
jgi:hypothetical protein